MTDIPTPQATRWDDTEWLQRQKASSKERQAEVRDAHQKARAKARLLGNLPPRQETFLGLATGDE